MIDDTLRSLEQRIQEAESLDVDARAQLQELVLKLRKEVDQIDNPEQAESIVANADSGTREALRKEQDEDLLHHALEGMEKSVRGFSASHPDLAGVVNGICQQLSNLGI